MKAFVIGLIIAIVGILSGIINWSLVPRVLGIVVLVSWGISGILTGAFISGDRNRANNFAENAEDRRLRVNWAIALFLLGLPSAFALLVVWRFF